MTASGHDGLGCAVWRKSSRSSPTSNNCVEVTSSSAPTIIAVRDSKHHSGPMLVVTHQGWATFIREVKLASIKVG